MKTITMAAFQSAIICEATYNIKLVLNIGRNIGSQEDALSIVQIRNAIEARFPVILAGQYSKPDAEIEESTIVAALTFPASFAKYLARAGKELCIDLQQQAIAAKLANVGIMFHWNGAVDPCYANFNEDYFINA